MVYPSSTIGNMWPAIEADLARMGVMPSRLEEYAIFLASGTPLSITYKTEALSSLFTPDVCERHVQYLRTVPNFQGQWLLHSLSEGSPPFLSVQSTENPLVWVVLVLRDLPFLSPLLPQAALKQSWGTPVRFTWKTDEMGQLERISPSFCECVGVPLSSLVGRHLPTLLDEVKGDPEGHVSRALHGCETWHDLEIRWPQAQTGNILQMRWGGLPLFDRYHRFRGFRGFGLMMGLGPPSPSYATPPWDDRTPPPQASKTNVVDLLSYQARTSAGALSEKEKQAFEEIGQALETARSFVPNGGDLCPPKKLANILDKMICQPVLPPPSSHLKQDDWPNFKEEPLIPHAKDSAYDILEIASDGLVFLDSQGRILSINSAAQTLLGDGPKGSGEEFFLALLARETRPLVQTCLDRLRTGLSQEETCEGLGRVRKGQGGQPVIWMIFRRLRRPAGEEFCVILRDMTQWKATEAELRKAQQAAEAANALKSDFLAKVNHEIRTPLNAILGFSEVMLSEQLGPLGNDRYKEYLSDIHFAGTHVLSLVNDLLDLAKIEAGKVDLHPAYIDLNVLIERTLALLQPQANAGRVIIRLSLSENLPELWADERSLRQILLNLLSNALKFTSPGGQVIISTITEESGDIILRIRDTGIGMSAEDLRAIFEPFHQGSSSLLETREGTGLGLVLTKALVEANHATLMLQSQEKEGTLVEIFFPRILT